MTEPVKQRRPYRSAVRDERARETRRRILDAAAARFLELGYARAPIRRIAEDAAVSEDLVFHLFKSKRGLLKEVMDVGIGGDDADVALLERPEPLLVRDEVDQRRQIEVFAAGVGAQLERVRPLDDMLRSAAVVDDELAGLRADLQLRQRREAMTTITRWIAARGPLRQEVDEAAALVWTLTSPEVHHMLTDGWGWAPEQYVAWLRTNLEAALLG
ncbi:TetR/AcrR family transcriptional regulator [Nocardioides sp. KIGAM211]|uniref:TetR/AcrR family transcriptional regulator n=1 Tax=Nocardioides luti TaxID=2761101 RepID=A0A7X0RLN6_9ACTN|nr:TetR/AcrR family transcriptional regulator [Nocardioides luti]MBB6629480.1 TetR/AcrR family transcriptional regulator [Nocardioides luti]